jgi:NADPH2:quinone reductase
VGTALCQLGRHFGLKVVATASLHKQDYVRKQGAVAVDYRSEHLAKDLKGHAPDGYDAAFDAIGNKSFPRSFKLLNSRGTLITYGTLEKASAIEKKTFLNFLGFGWSFALMMLGNWCRNLWNGDKKAHFFGVVTSLEKDKEKFQRDLDFLVGLLESGAIKPEIHKELSLHEVKKGHEMYENGEVCGQLVINMYK